MSASELVDVVDEHDRVVSRAPRSEVRKRNLRHRSVYIFVFNGAGQLFVHLRSLEKDIFPGYWDTTIGGVLAAGEAYDDGAARELREELGVECPGLRRLFPFRFEDETNCVLGMVYSGSHDGPFVLQASEIQRGGWEDLDQIIDRSQRDAFCPDGLEALRLYLAKLAAVQSRR
jgi:isopentenyldiphosphate isomerase